MACPAGLTGFLSAPFYFRFGEVGACLGTGAVAPHTARRTWRRFKISYQLQNAFKEYLFGYPAILELFAISRMDAEAVTYLQVI